MIEVSGLTKRYGGKLALDNVSFTVNAGEILGFLGPNGAGKTTTMNIITGYLSSTAGTVTVDGHEILSEPMAVKSRIGYLPEQPPLYLDMTVREYLHFLYALKRVRLPRKQHLEEICALVGITDVWGRSIRNLSKGYRQRVGLAQALLGNPDVLILDEPTVGLDPQQIIEIRRLIKRLGKKHTVILSSHILSEIQAVCDRVLVISQGRLLADDTPDHLSQKLTAQNSLQVRVDGPQEGVQSLLRKLPGVTGVTALDQREPGAWDYQVLLQDGQDIRRALFRRLADRSWPILSLQQSQLSLEEVFLQLVTSGSLDQNAATDQDTDTEQPCTPDHTAPTQGDQQEEA